MVLPLLTDSPVNSHNLLGVIIHGVLLMSIVVATTILGVLHDINGDAVVGLFGAVAATTAGTTAYRAGRQQDFRAHSRAGDTNG